MTQIEAERSRPAPGGRVSPSVIEAEESLIGAMLLSSEAVSVAYENVAGRRLLPSIARSDLQRDHRARLTPGAS